MASPPRDGWALCGVVRCGRRGSPGERAVSAPYSPSMTAPARSMGQLDCTSATAVLPLRATAGRPHAGMRVIALPTSPLRCKSAQGSKWARRTHRSRGAIPQGYKRAGRKSYPVAMPEEDEYWKKREAGSWREDQGARRSGDARRPCARMASASTRCRRGVQPQTGEPVTGLSQRDIPSRPLALRPHLAMGLPFAVAAGCGCSRTDARSGPASQQERIARRRPEYTSLSHSPHSTFGPS